MSQYRFLVRDGLSVSQVTLAAHNFRSAFRILEGLYPNNPPSIMNVSRRP